MSNVISEDYICTLKFPLDLLKYSEMSNTVRKTKLYSATVLEARPHTSMAAQPCICLVNTLIISVSLITMHFFQL